MAMSRINASTTVVEPVAYRPGGERWPLADPDAATVPMPVMRMATRHGPGRYRTGNRLFFTAVFWFALVASVEVWWLNTPSGSVSSPATALIAAGRVTGMIGGYLLLVQVLMMSRVAWLEAWVGAHD